jgi:hypothetical protein
MVPAGERDPSRLLELMLGVDGRVAAIAPLSPPRSRPSRVAAPTVSWSTSSRTDLRAFRCSSRSRRGGQWLAARAGSVSAAGSAAAAFTTGRTRVGNQASSPPNPGIQTEIAW